VQAVAEDARSHFERHQKLCVPVAHAEIVLPAPVGNRLQLDSAVASHMGTRPHWGHSSPTTVRTQIANFKPPLKQCLLPWKDSMRNSFARRCWQMLAHHR